MTANFSCSTQLGENHAYRFDGDFVQLKAEVSFADADLMGGQDWALQLWSSAEGFAAGLNGVKIGEIAIVPMAGGIIVDGLCNAMPPAGVGEQVLALALVAFADGVPQVRDLAVYAAPESFFLPCLVGEVSCSLADGSAELAIEAISNSRAVDNLSGTLSLEVWALDAPYAGGSWTGSPVASLVLGTLGGGCAWTDCRFTVPAAVPESGSALTVMLREWTAAGYVTRDYRNFPAKTSVPLAASPVGETAAVAVPKEVEAAETPVVAAPVVAAGKKPAKKATAKAVAKTGAKTVSINHASEAELLAVKGLPSAVARAIIAARPFATLEEVCKAKGMGPKKLLKLRDQLSL